MNSYYSYSKDFSQIGDRRRTGLWINKPDFNMQTLDGRSVNINVVTPFTDPFLVDNLKAKSYVILDLVDGYLVEETSLPKDYLRYFLRSSKLKAILSPRKFSDSLKEICRKVDLIVVASKEQADIAYKYNEKISIIRDSHDELGEPLEIKPIKKSESYEIFWEGLGFTIHHFEEIADALGQFLLETNSVLNLVTNITFPRYANAFGRIETEKEIRKLFGISAKNVRIHAWSQENVKKVAGNCDFGVIPISEHDKFARLKPENKLLIYWRLGLQTLFSDTPSYVRLSSEVGISDYAVKSGEWPEKLRQITESKDYLSRNMPKARDYLLDFHSNQVILGQWKATLKSLSKSTL
jgi:hypothetical protein